MCNGETLLSLSRHNNYTIMNDRKKIKLNRYDRGNTKTSKQKNDFCLFLQVQCNIRWELSQEQTSWKNTSWKTIRQHAVYAMHAYAFLIAAEEFQSFEPPCPRRTKIGFKKIGEFEKSRVKWGERNNVWFDLSGGSKYLGISLYSFPTLTHSAWKSCFQSSLHIEKDDKLN